MTGAEGVRAEPVTLAQIVGALSVTLTDAGVVLWLRAMHRDGMCPLDAISVGRINEVAEKVARMGDCDPREVRVVVD